MQETDPTLTAAPAVSADREVPLWRLYLLRLGCLIFIIQSFSTNLPRLFYHAPDERGVLVSMFGGLWLMTLIGLRYPMKMIPVFLFEFAWKSVWLIFFGLPQYTSGVGSPRLAQDMTDIGLGPIIFGLIIPWGYVWRHFVRAPIERWR